MTIATAANAFLLLVLWVIEARVAERVRFLVWLTYVPQQPLGIPILILVLCSAIARSRALIAGNLAVLALFSFTFLGFNIPFGASNGENPFKVMTLNTFSGRKGVDAIVELIRRENPDIVCLQETGGARGRPDPSPRIRELMKGWNAARAAEVMTLTRHPILSENSHPMLPGMGRAALQTRIRLPQGEVTVFNVHYNTNYRRRPDSAPPAAPTLASRSMARWEQTTIILEAAKKIEGPVIVAGDFNNPPRGLVYRRLAEAFTDAFRAAGWGFGYTYRSDFPLMRIDYVFAGAAIGVSGCRAIDSTVSDHRAVIADLMLPR